MANKKLYLFTISFPYASAQESNFVLPDLAKLTNQYEEIVIVPAQTTGEMLVDLGPKISVDTRMAQAFLQRGRLKNFVSCRFVFWWVQICFQVLMSGKPSKLSLCFNAIFFSLRMSIARRYLKEISENADLFTFWNTYVTAAMAKMHTFKGRRWTRVHGDDLYPERQGGVIPFEKQTFQKLDEIVFASSMAKEFFINRHPRIRTNLSIAHIGVILPKDWQFKIAMPRRNPIVLVTCSGLIAVKRLHLINSWVKKWNDDYQSHAIEWHHLGASTDDIESHLGVHCEGRGHGWMSQEQVMKWYQLNQPFAFLSVSQSEGGFPVSMQEALLCGIPIIGSANDGVVEALEISNGFDLPASPEFEDFKNVIEHVISLSDNDLLLIRQNAMDVGKTHFLR